MFVFYGFILNISKILKIQGSYSYGYVLLDDCQSSRSGGVYYGDISSTGGLRE